MTLIWTALNLGEKITIYAQVLTFLITPKIWLFHVVRDLKIYDGDVDQNVTSKYNFALV